ncbi:MAG: response regulator [Deltaproteobacteria bacterium]|nr:response regulator [Deltaproteobacteria bacterium]
MRSRAVKILVLDDDSDTGEVLRYLLSKEGFRVEVVTSPRAGLEMLQTRQYHILLLDLKMPEMDGIDVLKKLREKDTDIAVIIVTGYPSVDSAVASLKGGVSDYVEKPVDKEKLLAAVNKIVDEKGLLRSPEDGLLASIGARIRAERKQQELTLKQVARRTGLSVSLLSQIERAESAASVSSLFKITSALKTNLETIFRDY